jgi:hypothetical protein
MRPKHPTCVFAVDLRDIAVPVKFVIVSKLAQAVFPDGAAAVPLETQAFQFKDTE